MAFESLGEQICQVASGLSWFSTLKGRGCRLEGGHVFLKERYSLLRIGGIGNETMDNALDESLDSLGGDRTDGLTWWTSVEGRIRQVDFVEDEKCIWPKAGEVCIRHGPRHRCIKDENGERGRFQLLSGEADSVLFDRMFGVTEACCVAEFDGPTVEGGGRGHQVAGGARRFMDNGPTISEKGVHEAALADIGATGEDDSPRSLKMTSARGEREELLD